MPDDVDPVQPAQPEPKIKHDHPLSFFFKKNTTVHKSKDDDELIDIHVGNPLKKITQLLEDIKNQKAFTFTLKGSLGIMGVALVIGTFGVFGGTKAFCEKGVQTKAGMTKQLIYLEEERNSWVDFVPILNSFFPHRLIKRTVLLAMDNTIYTLRLSPTAQAALQAQIAASSSYITGSLDSCSNTITVESPNGIEVIK